MELFWLFARFVATVARTIFIVRKLYNVAVDLCHVVHANEVNQGVADDEIQVADDQAQPEDQHQNPWCIQSSDESELVLLVA